MMQRRSLQWLLVFALVIAPAAWAQCTFPVHTGLQQQSGHEYTVTWDPVPGAVAYTYIETPGSLADDGFSGGNERTLGATTTLERTHYSTINLQYDYIIRAYGAADPLNPICAGTAHVFINADTNLRNFTNRGIIPVAGSAPGAYGARFKTYLRLVSSNSKGAIVFHPAGQAESDSDPSMRYELTKEIPQLEWDDVVAAIGTSGIGSLAIVPDLDSYMPRVDTRVYNDAPTGKFGSAEKVYFPADYITDSDGFIHQVILYSDPTLRLNLGGVTLYEKTHAIVSVTTPEGKIRGGLARTLFFRSPGMYLGSLDSYNIDALPGDTINVIWDKPAIGFHTRTDNQTNDPFIYVTDGPGPGTGNPGYFVQ